MSYREYRPHPALSRFVEVISASDDRGAVLGPPVRVTPDGGSDLLFSVAAPRAGGPGPCRGALYGTNSHLLRDFHDFAGTTPGRLLAEPVSDSFDLSA